MTYNELVLRVNKVGIMFEPKITKHIIYHNKLANELLILDLSHIAGIIN